ncbi:hypothetical protein [uncultured Psychromonas sp.]|uniref:hypothetical protein n=1 Tax=uncultured Psychromonas sp. TaxID=173974 RepID=UPI00262DFC3B|nr:hypothetical protein [uncultured Psychromonas sp.]
MVAIAYKISSGDPDIIMMKEFFGDDLDVFHPRHKRKYVPGSEENTWHNLDLFTDNLLTQYLKHCATQCKYMLEWRNHNWNEVINIIPKLHEESKRDEVLKENLAFTLKKTQALDACEYDVELVEILDLHPLDIAVISCSSAWTALATYCADKSGVLNRVTDISSESLVRKHHFLAVVAMQFITYLQSSSKSNDVREPIRLLPVIYLLINDAEIAQQEWNKKTKTRLVLSPDSFLFRKMVGGGKASLLRDQIKYVFLKGWLYHVTSKEEESSQTHLIYKIQHEFGIDGSESALKRRLKKIREPGSLLAEYVDEDTDELS